MRNSGAVTTGGGRSQVFSENTRRRSSVLTVAGAATGVEAEAAAGAEVGSSRPMRVRLAISAACAAAEAGESGGGAVGPEALRLSLVLPVGFVACVAALAVVDAPRTADAGNSGFQSSIAATDDDAGDDDAIGVDASTTAEV